MYSRVKKVFIGKDINRTSSLTSIYSSSVVPAEGEILVLDKNFSLLPAGSTIGDTATIYIAEGTGDTYTYVNQAGTTVTGVRKFIFSNPITGSLVKTYSGKAYTAKAEKTASIILVAPTAAREYVIRIVYKDVKEHPGQYTHTYRYIATATDAGAVDTYGANLVALINSDSKRRVLASYTDGTDTLLLTGIAIPACTTSITDIDEFSMVDFDVYYSYVDSTSKSVGALISNGITVTYTGPTYGYGTWERVRDDEKAILGQQFGINNRIQFPVPSKVTSPRVVKSETYDCIVIEHDKAYQSGDNQYEKTTALETVIFIPNTATSNQMDSVLAILNPWMASTPGAFGNVTF
jgi:hypothetical protein